MAEPTLAIPWTELQARVGTFLGWGRGSLVYNDLAWSSYQQFEIDGVIASGLRQFYYPPPMEGMTGSYDWSFLKPVWTADFPKSVSVVPMPDDFGGFEGPITILTTSQTSQPWRIEWRNEGMIREMYSRTPQMSGPPLYAAEQVIKGTTATQGQRFQLFLFPLADQDYQLQFQYYINPDFLNGAFPFAYGGPSHAETILESCYAVAEVRQDDSSSVHAAKFQERLAASISMDRRNKPQSLGYNADRSDCRRSGRTNLHWFAPAATYNGNSFN